MIIVKIAILLVLFAILSFSARLLINSFKKISAKLGGRDFALSSLIIGLGTSIPELIIAIDAALIGKPNLSLGNVLGSNIANLSLVIGGATLLAGKVKIMNEIVKKDVYYTFLIAAAPLLLLSDGQLNRLDGAILLVLFFAWQALVFSKKKKRRGTFLAGLKTKATSVFSAPKALATMAASLVIMLLTAEGLVKTALSLATDLKVPFFLLGVFVLGAGSSLPELVFETQAIKKGEKAIVMGDLFGSIVANSSLILGITVLIAPLTLFQVKEYLTISLFFLVTFFLFYLFIKSKHMLEKWEGAFLVASYFVLLALQFG